MFDIAKRKRFHNVVVSELIQELQSFPENAVINCCGDNLLYIHVEKDGSVVSIDTEDLDELYETDPDLSHEDYFKYTNE